jgi:ElaB/YqjD/DUF883 family membrane-anchored ribosome-binding protein
MESTHGASNDSQPEKDEGWQQQTEAATGDSSPSALRKLVAYGEDLLRKTAGYSAEGLAATRDKFQSSLDELKARLGDVQVAVKDKALYATEATEDYASANPWKALAIAGSIGVVIGYLMGRRR